MKPLQGQSVPVHAVTNAAVTTHAGGAVPALRRRVGLICNPNSGRNRKYIGAIERMVAMFPEVRYAATAAPEDIADALEILAGQDIDVLAINGGDGTVAHVLTHLRRNPKLAHIEDVILLPGGTTNMNVGDVGVQGHILKGVAKLGQWAQGELDTREVAERPIIEVIPGAGRPPLYGMIFGTGAIVQAIEYWHQSVKTSGFRDEFSSGLAMVRTIWGLLRGDPRFSQPVRLEMQFEHGERLEQDVMLMAVSSMRRVFLNFRPFWGSEDGELHMSVIRHRAERFLWSFFTILRGKPGRRVTPEAGYRSHNLNRLSISMTGPFTMDGDIFHVDKADGPVVISHHCTLRFLRF